MIQMNHGDLLFLYSFYKKYTSFHALVEIPIIHLVMH